MCLVIFHDFPHQYTGQSTPHCLSAMVLPVLSATGQHQVNISILFYRWFHPPLPGALESQPTPQETNRASTRPPQELIQTVAAATHAHARNPSQETIPCYTMPHDYGAMEPWRPPPVNIVTPTGWDESPQASDTKPKRHRPTTPTSPPTTMHQWVAFDTTMLDMWITCDAEVVVSFLEDIARGNSA